MAHTRNEVVRDVTKLYLSTLDPSNPPTKQVIQEELLREVENAYDLENAVRPKNKQWRYLQELLPTQIAEILLRLHPIINIACMGLEGNAEYDLLTIYQATGPDEGIYTSDERVFRNLIREYNYTIETKEINEILAILKDKAPRRVRNESKNLIAVNNGIFDYDTKTLMPFNPDYIFIAKSRINYNANATNPVIHNNEDNTDWDIETWMADLFDNQEITDLMWEILGAIIRPNVPWNKSAWFYSNTGNNGKGTLCELMRRLCGDGTYASIPLSDFSKDFALEPLTRATSIIVDENDVGAFIDKAANLKAVVTNDVIQINRKFKTPIAYKFKGFMVQCLNEYPRIKDKSNSFYRRQLFIPFAKCFTGTERKYIKHDYLQRKDVLEYALFRVLNTNYYQLSEPQACKIALDEYKAFNDPIRQFADEILPYCKWDLLPFCFLYDLYKAWFKRNSPNGTMQGKTTFIQDLLAVIRDSSEWECPDKSKQIRIGGRMAAAEPLIAEYGLTDWLNPRYKATDDVKLACHPVFKTTQYRGILRISAPSGLDKDNEE